VGGFTNAVVGGAAKLIRFAIQSPNFVHGVSGWSINKDGTAEFQSLTARGSITATTLTVPAGAGPGTPRIVIDNAGLRFYGTGASPLYTMSLSSIITSSTEIDFPATTGPTFLAPARLSYDTPTDVLTLISSEMTANNPGMLGRVELRSPNNPDTLAAYGQGAAATIESVFLGGTQNDDCIAQRHFSRASNPDSLVLDWLLNFGGASPNSAALVTLGEHVSSAFRAMSVKPIPGGINQVAFGQGPQGSYYYEQGTFSNNTWANGLAVLTPVVATTYSDYGGSKFSGNTFTCPETGPYDIAADLSVQAALGANVARFLLDFVDNTTGIVVIRSEVPGITGAVPCTNFSGQRLLTKGHVYTFRSLCSAGPITLEPTIKSWSIGRRL
jgi:hypothetical protein